MVLMDISHSDILDVVNLRSYFKLLNLELWSAALAHDTSHFQRFSLA